MKNKNFLQIIPLAYEGSLNIRPKEDYLLMPSVVAKDEKFNSSIITYSHFFFKVENKNVELEKKGIFLIRCKSIFCVIINILKERPDIIYSNSRTIPTLIAPLFAKKTILISHDCEPPHKAFARFLFKLNAKLFAIHRVNTPYEKQMLMKLGVKEEKIKLIPLSVDLEFFSKKYSEKEKLDVRKKYNLSDEYKYVTFVANFRSHKTPAVLIKSMRHLKNKKIKAILIGDDQLPRENLKPVKELIKENNVEDYVIHFTNFKSQEIRDVLAVSDAYIHPTFREGQCLAVYEAAATGKPLCLSSIGSFTSVFEKSAYFHEPNDDLQLSRNILESVKKSAKNKEFIEKNKKLIEITRYITVKKKLTDLFKELI